ncbi:MAG: class I SAM-dependent methyltransferase [Microvirga sp.]|nr:class I SAM-dependent methyltransferase [Microvirga sp.]
MTTQENAKASAWDLVGGLFWTKGRATARPTDAEIDIFLEGLAPGARVAIIGASTKDLVEAAFDRGLSATVLDFSAKMCADLADVVGSGADIRVQDITGEIPATLRGRFDAVLSDRLVNRFTREEAVRAFSGMLALLREGGTLHASIKLGFYPMDERMIEEGRRRQTLAAFYDESTRTIDFPAAGEILETCLLPHGEIDRTILLSWYRGRGCESRFDDADVLALASEAEFGELALRRASARAFPNAKETTCYVFEAVSKRER